MYTLSATGVDLSSIGGSSNANLGFVFTDPTFITSTLANVTLDSCSVTGATCSTATFAPGGAPRDLSLPQGSDDFIGFNIGGFTGYLFFQQGALGAVGTYSSAGFPVGTPGAGNFTGLTPAYLNVSTTPLPAALPLFASGLGVMALVARRKRRKAVVVAA